MKKGNLISAMIITIAGGFSDVALAGNNISGIGACNVIIQGGNNNTIQPAPCAPTAPISFRVCMGNGGGNNCLSGAQAAYDCNFYNGIGGGGPRTSEWLAEQFCAYNNNGSITTAPHHVGVYQNNGGGQCGWTGFQVTCFSP